VLAPPAHKTAQASKPQVVAKPQHKSTSVAASKPAKSAFATSEFGAENDTDSRVDKLFAPPAASPKSNTTHKAFLFILAAGIVAIAYFLLWHRI
jgi:hypothetical protein